MKTYVFIELIFLLILSARSSIAQPLILFSHERGLYRQSFELTLSSDDENAVILYSLDGSDPAISDHAFEGGSITKLTISPYITEGRAPSVGVVVRACARKNALTSDTETHTYLFISEVKYQDETDSPNREPYWPVSRQVPCHYSPDLLNWMRSDWQSIETGVSRKVVYYQKYFSNFEVALTYIPIVSLVTDPENLFNLDTGIYINSTYSGIDWERVGSMEMIFPDKDNFQINTGIRIRGGYSSSGSFSKHSFRLFFREEYGAKKLEYSLFGNNGTNTFDKIDLRSSQNNSWHPPVSNSSADFIHDCYARDIQGEMDQPYTRSEYFHLFLNGMYWGLYQTQERAEARYAESYLGGDYKDYDVIKSSGPSYDYPSYTLEATDGNLDAAYALWEIAIEGFSDENYFKAMGLNPDGTINPAYPKYLDPDNLIDYMMIIYFSGNTDGPGELNGGIRINNFFGIYNRENPDGFKFFIHDNETSFYNVLLNIVNKPTIAGWEFSAFNPGWLHQRLIENTEYRQRFTDRAYKYLYNNGILTENRNIKRFEKRIDQIDLAIIGESARWGGTNKNQPFTRDDTWLPAVNSLLEEYFPLRTQILINQYIEAGWMNKLLPPVFNESDFENEEYGYELDDETFVLINQNSEGTIYYTLDNTDPRSPGGVVSPSALTYSNPINVTQTTFLKARVKIGEEWSPLQERIVFLSYPRGFEFTEISYYPSDYIVEGDTLKGQDIEFIELKNALDETIDLSALSLNGAIHYTFPMNTFLDPGNFWVVTSDSTRFRKLYKFSANGQYKGNLSNGSEKIIVSNANGFDLFDFEYNENETWYKGAENTGYTLVVNRESIVTNPEEKEYWRVSTQRWGSPGAEDPVPVELNISINEVLAATSAPYSDAVELYNPDDFDIEIGNWYLSDERDQPCKWQIPDGSVVPAKGYLTFYEGHYEDNILVSDDNEFGSAFSLDRKGETIYLYSGNSTDGPGQFVTSFTFEPGIENISYGKYETVSGNVHTTHLLEATWNNSNSEAWKSPLIFSAINYHPIVGNAEFLVLKNRSDSILKLYDPLIPGHTWKIEGISFRFPEGIELRPGDSVYLVEKIVYSEMFRTMMGIGEETRIFNYNGVLKNSSEEIAIQCPLKNDSSANLTYITLEAVEYNDNKPWPEEADGNGYILRRIDEEAYANDHTNWKAEYMAIPVAVAGYNMHIKLNENVTLSGQNSYDPEEKALSYNWEFVLKPEGSNATLSASNIFDPQFIADIPGEYIFRLFVSNGVFQSAPVFVSVFAEDNHGPETVYYNRTIKVDQYETALLTAEDCFDPDFDPLYYTWEMYEKPEGSTVEMNSENINKMEFEMTPDLPGSYRYYLTVNDGEFSGQTVSIRVYASEVSGIETMKVASGFNIYPNPARDFFSIDINTIIQGNLNVSLRSLSGRTVYEKNIPVHASADINIDISGYSIPSGVYLVQLKGTDFTENKKLLIVR